MMQQKGRAKFEAGPVTFIVQHELWDGNVQDHSDQGVAVLVANQDETTLLRFNCFDIEKSYVYGPEKENKLFRMDHTTDGNPINWTMQQIRNNLSIMLETAGYADIAKDVDAKQVEKVLPDVEAHAREMYATGRNTVKHNRGTDIFEVGNIRFGLEMRRQASGEAWPSTFWPTWPGRRAVITRKKPNCWPLIASATLLITITGPGTRITGYSSTRLWFQTPWGGP